MYDIGAYSPLSECVVCCDGMYSIGHVQFIYPHGLPQWHSGKGATLVQEVLGSNVDRVLPMT